MYIIFCLDFLELQSCLGTVNSFFFLVVFDYLTNTAVSITFSNANLACPTEDNDSLWDPTRTKLVVRTALGPPGLAMAAEKSSSQVVTLHTTKMQQGVSSICITVQVPYLIK